MKIKKLLLTVFAFLFLCVDCVGLDNKVEAINAENLTKASLLMDFGTGQVLEEHNSKEHLPIASVTKLTTLLLAFEALENGKLSLDDELTASERASSMGGSQVFIDANSKYKVENLLHAIVISSANDACVVIAEELAGSEEDFVVIMNEKVKSLGGMDTNYVNCSGLPSPNAYSCANDVALVMREIIKYPLYFEISKIWMEDFEHPSGRITQMANTNKLLRNYTGCDAGKTGSTNEAGFCMSATAKRGNMRLISVVLGASNSKERFNACAGLFDLGFANYTSDCIVDSAKNLDIDFVVNMAKNQSPLKAEEDYFVLNKKGEKSNLEISYQMENVVAPLSGGTVVGKIIISKDNIVEKEINILLVNDVEAMNWFDRIKEIASKW